MIKVTNTKKIRPGYAHWFVYGRMRTGKTRMAATFPNPFYIVPYQEGSHVSLMGRDIDFVLTHGYTGKARQVSGGTAYSMQEVLSHLEACHKKAKALWQKGDEDSIEAGYEAFPWETIVVESITHYTDLVQEELTRGNTLDMDQQKWGKLSAGLRSVHARLRALPVHVVFISLSVEHHNQKGELTGGGPAFPGNMKYKLPSACECVVFMDGIETKNGKGRYTAHFRKHGVFDAGCRFSQLTEMGSMAPFDFTRVEKILGTNND